MKTERVILIESIEKSLQAAVMSNESRKVCYNILRENMYDRRFLDFLTLKLETCSSVTDAFQISFTFKKRGIGVFKEDKVHKSAVAIKKKE